MYKDYRDTAYYQTYRDCWGRCSDEAKDKAPIIGLALFACVLLIVFVL